MPSFAFEGARQGDDVSMLIELTTTPDARPPVIEPDEITDEARSSRAVEASDYRQLRRSSERVSFKICE